MAMLSARVKHAWPAVPKTPDIICPDCGTIIVDGEAMDAETTRQYFFATLREDVYPSVSHMDVEKRWPNEVIFRKHGLIAIGWCNVKTIVITSKQSALEVMLAMRALDAYSIVTIDDPGPRKPKVVSIFTAKSLDRRSIRKKEFVALAEKFWHWVYQTTGINASGSEAA